MEIVIIDSNYTDYLYKTDPRVSKNINMIYQRPYIGVLFRVQDNEYFAPLTTHSKGKRLFENPKPENVTFLPIEKCQYGGINFNNMIPVVKGVYWQFNIAYHPTDAPNERAKKDVYNRIVRFLRKHEADIITKAKNLYDLKYKGKLYDNYDKITCDFQKLETVAKMYAGAK